MELPTDQVRPVEEILEQNSRLPETGTFGTGTMIFALLSEDDSSAIFRTSLLFSLLVTALFILLVLMTWVWNEVDNAIVKASGVAAILTVGFATWLASRARKTDLRKFASSLKNVVTDLESTRDGLIRYQKRLDQRTSKYFHCVTQQKVTTYFVLNQLSAALQKRVELVNTLLTSSSRKNVRAAHELLHKDLTFTDGATPETGTERRVQMIFLNRIVSDLIENLNISLDLLEKDLELSPSSDNSS